MNYVFFAIVLQNLLSNAFCKAHPVQSCQVGPTCYQNIDGQGTIRHLLKPSESFWNLHDLYLTTGSHLTSVANKGPHDNTLVLYLLTVMDQLVQSAQLIFEQDSIKGKEASVHDHRLKRVLAYVSHCRTWHNLSSRFEQITGHVIVFGWTHVP